MSELGSSKESNGISKLILLCGLFILLYVLHTYDLPAKAYDQFKDAAVSNEKKYNLYREISVEQKAKA